jgi:alpha-mannosidase
MGMETINNELRPGTTLNGGQFTVLDIIGQGGFGITYRARQNKLNRTVCIKEYFLDGRCQRNAQDSTISITGTDGAMFERYREGFVKEAEYAYVGTHRHGARENKDLPYEFTYLFNIALDVPAGTRSITLPVNRKVMVFAATAVQDDINTAAPVSDLLRFPLPASPEPELEIGQASQLARATLSDASGRTNNNEAPAFAVDDDPETKWCDNSAKPEKFIAFDLGGVKTLTRWTVLHAASESQSYVTKAFALQVRNAEDEPWRTVDEVAGNRDNETDRKLSEPVQARFVRLNITQGDQVDTNISRIYEFGVY